MTTVVHSARKKEVKKKHCSSDAFLLADRKGGYLSLTTGKLSRYNGWFFNDGEKMFKVLEDISIVGAPSVDKVTNKLSSVERRRGEITEKFFVPHGHRALVCQLNSKQKIELLFDCKESYDSREYGRYYELIPGKDHIILAFTKKTDEKEDDSHGNDEYNFYVAIKGSGITVLDEWVERTYDADKERGSHPFSRHVYKPIRLKTKIMVLGVGKTKEQAIEELDNIMRYYKSLETEQNMAIKQFPTRGGGDHGMAYLCAQDSLDKLCVDVGDSKGIFAGYPWFFQFWTRDESISLKAFMLMNRYDDVRDIIFRNLGMLLKDGRLANRYPASDLGSSDGVGWFFKRVGDFIHLLEKKRKLAAVLPGQDLYLIKKGLEESIFNTLKNYGINGFVSSGPQETWMDTVYQNDTRKGIRIEIQALMLNMYKLLKKLSKMTDDNISHQMAERLERELNEKVRKAFLHDDVLWDGLNDGTIRPNIFLAYYVYPELLTNGEWRKVFRRALKSLYLDWGGLATIDKKHQLYCDTYTGQDDRSYHRGDSWFFVNNLAAISLARLGRFRFRKYIKGITKASTEDILYNGFIGHSSEVSSAKERTPSGCQAQAWSAATFIELAHELY